MNPDFEIYGEPYVLKPGEDFVVTFMMPADDICIVGCETPSRCANPRAPGKLMCAGCEARFGFNLNAT